jgi:hypothetical protein
MDSFQIRERVSLFATISAASLFKNKFVKNVDMGMLGGLYWSVLNGQRRAQQTEKPSEQRVPGGKPMRSAFIQVMGCCPTLSLSAFQPSSKYPE